MKKEISYLETIKMIDETKKIFETQIEKRLGLINCTINKKQEYIINTKGLF